MARGFTLALCCIGNAIAFLLRTHLSAPTSLRSADADDYPSDATEPVEAALIDAAEAAPPMSPDALKVALFGLGAATSRGESATADEKDELKTLATMLEGHRDDAAGAPTARAKGTWELCASTTQLFRSSPFFMAGRAVCAEGEEAKRYNWFCDMHRAALAISTIDRVRQVVSDDKVTSEFEVDVGAVPFLSDYTPFSYSGGLPVTIRGAIVSTADITRTDATEHELFMDTVRIKGSNIPGLRALLDGPVALDSRALSSTLEGIDALNYAPPKPVFRTTFCDDTIRVSRDQDDNVFVYRKVSSSTEPRAFDDAPSDLNVGSLVAGFVDSFSWI